MKFAHTREFALLMLPDFFVIQKTSPISKRQYVRFPSLSVVCGVWGGSADLHLIPQRRSLLPNSPGPVVLNPPHATLVFRIPPCMRNK